MFVTDPMTRRSILRKMTGISYRRPLSYSRLIGVGGARGDRIVSNDDLAEALERDDDWIRRRTGIVTRRHASREVLVQHLAEQAARAALDASGVPAGEMDVIIVSTVTWMQMTPGMAPLIGERVGASPSAAAYDVNAGCAGFCYAIAQADAMIRSGLARHALVVGAEKLVDFTDPTERTISFILGDGAGAVVLGPSDTPGVGPTVWGSDGRKGDAIRTTHDWLEYKYADDFRDVPWPTAEQDGPTIFRWATSVAPHFAAQAIEAAGLTPADIDVFIPHQANLRIVETMAHTLGLREDAVIARDVIDTGNTSGASVPLAMERLLREGTAHGGQTALLFGFGAGLCYASQVVELPAAVGGDGEYHAAALTTVSESGALVAGE
jgi:3-oxoacyl-[acyl-carrier-protein] synthase-3